MKPMRVLNCTKEDREIIFGIADKVGCPVGFPARDFSDIVSFPHLIFRGEFIDATCDDATFTDVSFSEFITELLKYEKPKVWVTKDAVVSVIADKDYNYFTAKLPHGVRNPKFTYEVQEEQK